jgi:hypothetical protein
LSYSDEQRFTTCGVCARATGHSTMEVGMASIEGDEHLVISIVAYLLICKRRRPYGVLFGGRGLLSHLNREYNPAFEG